MDKTEAQSLAAQVRAKQGYKVEMITMLPVRNPAGEIDEVYTIVARYMRRLTGARSIARNLRGMDDWADMQRECTAWSRLARYVPR